mgnify:CR=1 FL=1
MSWIESPDKRPGRWPSRTPGYLRFPARWAGLGKQLGRWPGNHARRTGGRTTSARKASHLPSPGQRPGNRWENKLGPQGQPFAQPRPTAWEPMGEQRRPAGPAIYLAQANGLGTDGRTTPARRASHLPSPGQRPGNRFRQDHSPEIRHNPTPNPPLPCDCDPAGCRKVL